MNVDARSYRVFVEPLSVELGGGFASYAPELKGCISDGASPDEALNNIYDAITCWIDAARASGQSIPQPTVARQYA
ncbi:type II toxin-antitoxin system HicB family antitoxin [Sphingomonas bacterium]|uniref:type II toxin-antitoxin system HicB family antitoxin n=1 Tax=Sphingomonas bacterium TaxID=1895847 RepID=UPI0015766618|nr:type II toxin-antitoxin system HicB family antitoxin [Sphingomonas bacterium]